MWLNAPGDEASSSELRGLRAVVAVLAKSSKPRPTYVRHFSFRRGVLQQKHNQIRPLDTLIAELEEADAIRLRKQIFKTLKSIQTFLSDKYLICFLWNFRIEVEGSALSLRWVE